MCAGKHIALRRAHQQRTQVEITLDIVRFLLLLLEVVLKSCTLRWLYVRGLASVHLTAPLQICLLVRRVQRLNLLLELPIICWAWCLAALGVLRLKEWCATTISGIPLTEARSLLILSVVVHDYLADHLGLQVIKEALVRLRQLLLWLLLLLRLDLRVVDCLESVITIEVERL